MLNKILYVFLILTCCLVTLAGCEEGSTNPTIPSNTSSKEPIHFVIDAKICQITVDSSFDEEGKRDFMLDIVYMKQDLFFIQIDGSSPTGMADGVDVDIFGQDLMSWGTLQDQEQE